MKKINSIRFNSFILFAIVLAVFFVSATFITILSEFSSPTSKEVNGVNVSYEDTVVSSDQDSFRMAETDQKHIDLTSWLKEKNPSANKVKAEINNLINTHKVIVFAKSTCRFCQMAISLLDSKVPSTLKQPFTVVNVDYLPGKFHF